MPFETVKRPRAKPVFRSELPLRVDRHEFDGRFAPLIAEHGLGMSLPAGGAEARLEEIARRLRHSRKLAFQRVSRPDASRTLKELAAITENLAGQIAALPAQCFEAFDVNSGCLLFDKATAGALFDEWLGWPLEEFACYLGRQTLSRQGATLDPTSTSVSAIARAAEDIAAKIRLLPIDAAWPIILIEQYVARPEFPETERSNLHRLVISLKHMARLCRIAETVQKSERGPRSDTPQFLAVKALAGLFEKAKEKQVSHSAHADRMYTGRSRSPFGLFVHDFMQIVDAGLKDRHGLDEAIAFVCWPSRFAGREAKVEQQRALRERNVLNAIDANPPVTNNSHQQQ